MANEVKEENITDNNIGTNLKNGETFKRPLEEESPQKSKKRKNEQKSINLTEKKPNISSK